MQTEDEIRDLCKRLIASEDEAQIRFLANRLRALIHQAVEDARSQAACLPMLETAPQRKKAA
jgi:hypothetical protein